MSSLPPVRTGGKKPPAAAPAGKAVKAPPVSAGAKAAGPSATTTVGTSSGPGTPRGAVGDDTRARVAREREERMAAVRSAKADAAGPKAPPAEPAPARKTVAPAPAAPAAAEGSASSSPRKQAPAAPAGGKKGPAPSPPSTKPPNKATPPPAASAAKKAPAQPPASAKGKTTPPPAPVDAPAAKKKSPTPPPQAVAAVASPPAAPSKELPAAAVPAEPSLKNPASHFKLSGPDGVDVTSEGTPNLVYECFEGEGVLFRIVEPAARRWSFYNDTDDMEVTAEVTLMKGSDVRVLGSAKKTTSEDGELVVTDVVQPGKTQPFFEGRVRGYAAGFSAASVSTEAQQVAVADSAAIIADETKAVKALIKNMKVNAQSAAGVLKACAMNNVAFVDPEFSPSRSVFYRVDIDEPIDIYPLLRPKHFLPPQLRDKIQLINSVEPNDIDQGLLGDCWLLCAICSLAEFPDKVQDLFRHPKGDAAQVADQAVGGYHVTLMHDGWWQIVVIDDFLPSQGGRACFARNIEDPAELWVSLIEKAYAKLKGSYAAIIGGDPLHALEDLTGYPTARLDRKFQGALQSDKAANALFQDLLRYDQAGYLITVGTPTPDLDDPEGAKMLEEKYDENGLTVDHSYSVICVREFKEVGVQLLKIRNPWGNDREWGGAWSDNSSEWQKHPDVAKACEFDGGANDGTFWMAWSDALDFFESGGVCFMSNNWHDCRTKGRFDAGIPSVAMRVTCRKQTKAFLVLNQAAEPGFDKSKPAAKYAGAMVSVWRKDPTTGPQGQPRYRAHLNSNFDFDAPAADFTFLAGRSIGLLYTFEPSDEPYFVVPRGFNADVNKGYCLGIVSSDAVGKSPDHGLDVCFVNINSDVKAFENFDLFDFNPAAQAKSVIVPFQVNPEVGAPYFSSGDRVVECE
jgi:hypothetical protein